MKEKKLRRCTFWVCIQTTRKREARIVSSHIYGECALPSLIDNVAFFSQRFTFFFPFRSLRFFRAFFHFSFDFFFSLSSIIFFCSFVLCAFFFFVALMYGLRILFLIFVYPPICTHRVAAALAILSNGDGYSSVFFSAGLFCVCACFMCVCVQGIERMGGGDSSYPTVHKKENYFF